MTECSLWNKGPQVQELTVLLVSIREVGRSQGKVLWKRNSVDFGCTRNRGSPTSNAMDSLMCVRLTPLLPGKYNSF